MPLFALCFGVLGLQITLSEARNDLAEVALAQTRGVDVAAVAGEPPKVTLPGSGDTDVLLDEHSDVMS